MSTDISRRLGRTFIPYASLVADQDAHLAIAARGIVIRAEFLLHRNGLEQIAMSPDYDVVPDGGMPPDYEWLVERGATGAVSCVWARRC